MLTGLGELETTLGHNDQARADYDEAYALYKQEDNRLGQADVLRGLGELESKLGRNEQARADYGDALALYKQEDNRLGQANGLAGLAIWSARSAATIRLARPMATPSRSISRKTTASARPTCSMGLAP